MPAHQLAPRISAVAPQRFPAPSFRTRNNPLGHLAFWLVVALCTLNLNFVTKAILGKDQFFTVLYLLACVVTLFAFGFRWRPAMGGVGTLWLVTMFLFLAVSTRVGLGISKAYFLSPQSNVYRIVAAQMITVCCAMGARYVILKGKLQSTLRILFAMLMLASLTILLTKYVPIFSTFIDQLAQNRHGGFFVSVSESQRLDHILHRGSR